MSKQLGMQSKGRAQYELNPQKSLKVKQTEQKSRDHLATLGLVEIRIALKFSFECVVHTAPCHKLFL